MKSKARSKNKSEKKNATGDAVTPMATAAALDGSAFSNITGYVSWHITGAVHCRT